MTCYLPSPGALAAGAVPLIACPGDYTENLRVTDAPGELPGLF